MKRRGMSQIITTVIMIGIVLVAIGAVWVVAQNILNQGLEDVSLGSLKINMDIENIEITNDGIDVRVKRNSGEANLVGLNFIVSNGDDTEVFEVETNMKELATQTFSLDYFGVVESVEVAPILMDENGRERSYNSINIKELSLEETLVNLGAVSWWRLDGNAIDEIGDNDGAIVGNADCNVEGVDGEACEFDGDNGYVYVSGSEGLDANLESKSYVSWIKSSEDIIDGEGSIRSILSKYPESEHEPRFDIALEKATGYFLFDIESSVNTDTVRIDSDIDLRDNSWHQVVAIRDREDDVLRIYIDGIEGAVPVADTDQDGSNEGDFVIGDFPINLGNGRTFLGEIDDVIVFNRALTENEVEWLYRQGLN
ncbi:MAG: LamG domain-containing protein [Candidatus Pacearchaeota archaeon]|nr:LamG domain-containing protein [Candidatus Pacearchaeota archaeon]